MSEETRNLKSEVVNPKIQIPSPNLDLDELLRSFFRSEMPHSWPGFAALKIEEGGLRTEGKSGAQSACVYLSILAPLSSIL